MFALIDCNNFYASCERVFNPTLIDRPVVVSSNNGVKPKYDFDAKTIDPTQKSLFDSPHMC